MNNRLQKIANVLLLLLLTHFCADAASKTPECGVLLHGLARSEKSLGSPNYEVGIITGDKTINPILSLLIPGKDITFQFFDHPSRVVFSLVHAQLYSSHAKISGYISSILSCHSILIIDPAVQ
jgi:hypothetical protein